MFVNDIIAYLKVTQPKPGTIQPRIWNLEIVVEDRRRFDLWFRVYIVLDAPGPSVVFLYTGSSFIKYE